jgi:hypothetical protein
MASRLCQGFGATAPHVADQSEYSPNSWTRNWKYCRACDSQYRASRKAANPGDPSTTRRTRTAVQQPIIADFGKKIEVQTNSHDYQPDPDLVALWSTTTRLTLEGGADPANFMFLGPAGSGKTEGAKWLADQAKLPYTKTDAASMTDPESWFGTREVIVQEGVSVTKYIASTFVKALQEPGVLHIDEINRVDDEHRNVLLPVLDGTGEVTNPLTGEAIKRHEHCFIIMAGNRGLQFTGVSAIDPAFMTRSLVVEFNYIGLEDEKRIVQQETGCDEPTAHVMCRFAEETRQKAKVDEDFTPISTREVIMASRLVAGGLSRDGAVKFVMLNAASNEGGGESVRSSLQNIWQGVRLSTGSGSPGAGASPTTVGWVCPEHGGVKVVPAGVSAATNKPYAAFKACPVYGCKHTEDRDAGAPPAAQMPAPPTSISSSYRQGTCSECGTVDTQGSTYCQGCGATL